MSKIIPDISPKTFTLSAVVIGYLLLDDLSANEQNALGNWLMLIAQLLCTNAFYKEVRQERGLEDNDNMGTDKTIEMMQKMMKAMQKEIDELKQKNSS